MTGIGIIWKDERSRLQRRRTYTEVKVPEPIVDDLGAMHLTIGALESGGFYAADDFTDQFAEGETPQEAYAALCQVLKAYLASLHRLSPILPHQEHHRDYLKGLSIL